MRPPLNLSQPHRQPHAPVNVSVERSEQPRNESHHEIPARLIPGYVTPPRSTVGFGRAGMLSHPAQILSAREIVALNIARTRPGITIQELQDALDLKHKTTAARLLVRLREFGLIGRDAQFHLHQKAAA